MDNIFHLFTRSYTVLQSEFPGCCGIRVLHDANGYSSRLDQELREAADLKDYGCYLYTTVPRQRAIIEALRKAGFQEVGRFKSSVTGNWVTIHAKMKRPRTNRARTVRGSRATLTPRRRTKARRATTRR